MMPAKDMMTDAAPHATLGWDQDRALHASHIPFFPASAQQGSTKQVSVPGELPHLVDATSSRLTYMAAGHGGLVPNPAQTQ